MLLHRSEFFSAQIIGFTLKSLKEMFKALGLSQVVTKRKNTEAWRNGARILTKGYYSLEDVMSPNATKAFTTKNFL